MECARNLKMKIKSASVSPLSPQLEASFPSFLRKMGLKFLSNFKTLILELGALLYYRV